MEVNHFFFPVKGDERGSLVAIEAFKSISFPIQRIYYIFGTLPGVVRGRHAHHKLRQVLVCVHGTCTIMLDDGNTSADIELSKPERGIIRRTDDLA